MAYDDRNFLDGLQWLWGTGFLSPGGPQAVAEILQTTDIRGQSVLDFGCGIGGIDQLLVTVYGAAKVTGVDVVPSLVDKARVDAETLGLSDRIEYQLIEPGTLTFPDQSFDVVFSKDTLIHLPDKLAICQELFRLLKCGGVFVGSDWLGGDTTATSPRVREWLDFSKLDFHFCTASELHEHLRCARFESVVLRDRNKWYRRGVREEIDRVSGANYADFAERFGEDQAATRLKSSTLKKAVVDAGELRPTSFRAVKPPQI